MIGLDRHILSIAYQINKPITNSQLQKIWYFTVGYLIRNNDLDLAKREFENSNLEAWLYGPVIPTLYAKYNHFNTFPINDRGTKIKQFNRLDVNRFIEKLIKMSPSILIDLSRQHKFWINHESQIKYSNHKPRYKFKDLIKEFNHDK